MPRQGLFIDTNLLLLYVVGRVGKRYIARHTRLNRFNGDDFDALFRLVRSEDAVHVTPHTLAETSNLLGQHGEPERSRFLLMFRHVIHDAQEIHVAGVEAAAMPEFVRYGLTDAALLAVVSEDTPLLTIDEELFSAAFTRGAETAAYFPALRRG